MGYGDGSDHSTFIRDLQQQLQPRQKTPHSLNKDGDLRLHQSGLFCHEPRHGLKHPAVMWEGPLCIYATPHQSITRSPFNLGTAELLWT